MQAGDHFMQTNIPNGTKPGVRRAAAFALALALAALAWLPEGASAGTTLRIGGTGGALGTMRLAGEAFRKSGSGVDVTILPSLSTDGGIRAVLDGAIDLAVTARPLKPEEKARGAVERRYGRSAIVFIVHERQQASGFTQAQLADIYLGKTERWPDGTPLRMIMRPENGSETKSVMSLSPLMNRAVRAALERKGMLYALTDQETADKVEKIPGTIAPSVLALVLSENRRVRVLALDGVTPSVKSIADGSYPLLRDAWTVTGPSPSPAAKRFVEFLHSAAGKKLLSRYGQVAED
jgi:phosphate transport system substrate-binding protein